MWSEPRADGRAQPCACGEDRVRIDIAANVTRDIGFRRHPQRKRDEGGLERFIGHDGRERCDQALVVPLGAAGADRCDVIDQQRVGERLDRLPAVEWIGIVRGKEFQSSADTFDVSLIGAENPRFSDRTGRFGTPGTRSFARLAPA